MMEEHAEESKKVIILEVRLGNTKWIMIMVDMKYKEKTGGQ